MFTGLIEDVGTVAELEAGEDGARLRIATRLAGELEPGDSVAVNGVCLTAVGADRAGFAAEAMNQGSTAIQWPPTPGPGCRTFTRGNFERSAHSTPLLVTGESGSNRGNEH